MSSNRTRCALWILPCLAAAGCLQEIANQPRYDPLEASTFFKDGMSARPPVEGTVARGDLQIDEHYFQGKVNGEPAEQFPPRLLEQHEPRELLARGRARFNIFCSPCHGQVGGGRDGPEELEDMVGMVVKRGFPVPPSYHSQRLRAAPVGHLFNVITRGIGRMPAHDYLIPPEDRWAIVAYIRALQRSQHAQLESLSPDEIKQLGAPESERFRAAKL